MNQEEELDKLIDDLSIKRFDIHFDKLTKYIKKEFPIFLSKNAFKFCDEDLIAKFIDKIHKNNKIKLDSFYIDYEGVMKNTTSFYIVIKKPNTDDKYHLRINSNFSI